MKNRIPGRRQIRHVGTGSHDFGKVSSSNGHLKLCHKWVNMPKCKHLFVRENQNVDKEKFCQNWGFFRLS